MKVGFIGAGKVGFSLGKFFVQGGIEVLGYWSKHSTSSKEAALFTGTQHYESIEALVQACDALFLTVPDGEISSVFHSMRDFALEGKHICHCSGVMTAAEAFTGIEQTGAYGYSIHPLFPISNKYASYRELKDAFFCVEGSATHLTLWQELLSALGAHVQIIPGAAKVRYHAACAISSNLMCALVQESLELLKTCGFSDHTALQALTPLMRSNLDHLIQDGPVAALTGPIERNDCSTVQKHINCLGSHLERELYRFASQKLVQIAQNKHPERDYQQMTQLLMAQLLKTESLKQGD